MQNNVARQLNVDCLIFDKGEDKRLIEFGYPIVRNARSYQRYIEKKDVAVVVINLVNLKERDIEALQASKDLKKGGLLFVAIEGNVADDVVDQLERYLVFSRKISKEFTSDLLKFSISYSNNRNRFENMMSNLSVVESVPEENTRDSGRLQIPKRQHVVFGALSLAFLMGLLVSVMLFAPYTTPVVGEALAKTSVVADDDMGDAEDTGTAYSSEEVFINESVSDSVVGVSATKYATKYEEVEYQLNPLELKKNGAMDVATFKEQDSGDYVESSAGAGVGLIERAEVEFEEVEKRSLDSTDKVREKSEIETLDKEASSNSEVEEIAQKPDEISGFTQERVERADAADHPVRLKKGVLSDPGKKRGETDPITVEAERFKKLAVAEIMRKNYFSDDGRGAISYLGKIDSSKENGKHIAEALATEILFAVLDDYIESTKAQDTKRMRDLQSAIGVLSQYVAFKKVDILYAEPYLGRINSFFQKIEILRKEQENEVLINMMQEMGALLIRVGNDREKAYVLDSSAMGGTTLGPK